MNSNKQTTKFEDLPAGVQAKMEEKAMRSFYLERTKSWTDKENHPGHFDSFPLWQQHHMVEVMIFSLHEEQGKRIYSEYYEQDSETKAEVETEDDVYRKAAEKYKCKWDELDSNIRRYLVLRSVRNSYRGVAMSCHAANLYIEDIQLGISNRSFKR